MNKAINANHWLPFTTIKNFSQKPLLLKESQGVYYTTSDDRQIIDAVSGLWCCNCGHSRPEIAEAISKQASKMAYAPSFQVSHESSFEFAEELNKISPPNLNRIFFTNSGSESVDTALKMVLAYFRAIGKSHKQKFIGREKGYHGVGFGGISVGGIGNNRKQFGNMLAGVDHLPHTMGENYKAFSRGLPEACDAYANELINLINLHDASTIAAVIVEPIAGSAGVIIPPVNYLKRLRQICDDNDILLIFDEVITGFGRIGEPFASQRFSVYPDLMTTAKGLTNGSIPMGAVFAKQEIYDAFLDNTKAGIEFFHGYTYSASPLACAAGLAALKIYHDEGLFTRVKKIEKHFENRLHSFNEHPLVKDIRNFGLIGAIELKPIAGEPGARGYQALSRAFFEENLFIRTTGDIIAFAPPLIIEQNQIDLIFDKIGSLLQNMNQKNID